MDESKVLSAAPQIGEQVPLRLNVDVDKLKTEFADLVQIESNVDSVALSFIQRIPGNPPEDFPNATIVSRMVLTWPHFARVVATLQEVVDSQRDAAKENFNKSVFPNQQ